MRSAMFCPEEKQKLCAVMSTVFISADTRATPTQMPTVSGAARWCLLLMRHGDLRRRVHRENGAEYARKSARRSSTIEV